MGQTNTDFIAFFEGANYITGASLHQLPEALGTWNPNQDATFTLHLGNLPSAFSTTDILQYLNDGDLDVVIGNETGVDYMCLNFFQDSCCTDFDAFCQAVMNAVTVTVDNDSCKAIINVGNLSGCDFIQSIDWGDGQQSFDVLTSGGMAMHNYSGSNTYVISYQAIEYDNTGLLCFNKMLSDTITLVCSVTTPILHCSDMKLRVEHDENARFVFYDELTVEGDQIELSCTPVSGTEFPVGITPVTCTATDASGQTASCSFNVTVEQMPFDTLQPPSDLSPEGYFDHIRDRFGNPHRLSEIQIPETMGGNLLCGTSAGYFNLFFELGCGMDGNSQVEIDRRAVICQVFSDLSAFIIPANSNTKVNIWIRDISQIVSNPVTSGYLGLATAYYVMPSGAPNKGGIVDGQVWKTINSGVDAYTGVASPLTTVGGAGAGFYHGYMALNFSNPGFNWHTALNNPPGFAIFDLYTVALHEALHMLGFSSLINITGQSGLAPIFPKYYTRYDSYLRNASFSAFPLIVNTGACSPMYDYQFNYQNVNTSELQPNQGTPWVYNFTPCHKGIKFAGNVNQIVFTPNCFSSSSSLCHLEDLCHMPIAQPNDEYYVMSNSPKQGPVGMKRYPKPEERQVLCDLGYQVNTVYGIPGQLSFNNYGGSICNSIVVNGVNDGIGANGTFTYMTMVGTPITIGNVLANDHNATAIECLEIIFGGGSLSNVTGTSFSYNPTNTATTALLRYVPKNGNLRGNITYIYILVKNPDCNPDVCHILGDPGFEIGGQCGMINHGLTGSVMYCWDKLSGTPDLYGGPNTLCNNTAYQINVFPNPPTWNLAPTNDHYVGLWATNTGTQDYESVQTTLATPFIHGNTYTITFRARIRAGNVGGTNIQLAASPTALAPVGGNFSASVLSNVNVKLLGAPVAISSNLAWNLYSVTFTYTGITPLYNLIVANYPGTGTFIGNKYVFIDDIQLMDQASQPTFAPPTPVCLTAPFVDLNSTVSTPGGVFSGPGVVNLAGAYSFNPFGAGLGNHVITYTVTDANGCMQSVTATIQVVVGPSVMFSPFTQQICLNATPILLNGQATPTGGIYSGPGVFCSGTNCSFFPGAAGVGAHTITYTYTGGACPVVVTQTIVVIPCVDICEVSNNCLAFDGTDDFVNVPNPLNTPSLQNNFTVACWFRDDRQPSAPDNFLYRLFGLGWNGPRFEVGDQNNLLTFFSLQTGIVQSNINIRDGLWHHLAAIKNGNFVTIYLDCIPVNGLVNLNAGNFAGTAQNFHIGDWAGGPSNPRFWQGCIDEFKIWGAVLNSSQICDEKECSLDPNNINLLVHFPFDQFVVGNTLADNVMTGGADGTLVNFNFNGATSDWVDRGRDLLPVCNPDYFAYLEGNARSNIVGRSKVYNSDIYSAGQEVIPSSQPVTLINYPVFTKRFPDGTVAWRTILPVQGVISDFIRTDEGCFLLVGHTPAFTGDNQSFIARIDKNGNVDWLHEHDFGERESLSRIIRSDQPNNPNFPYVVEGIRRTGGTGPGSSYNDIVLFTIDNQGTIDWFRQLGDYPGFPSNDFFYADLINYQGGYALTGTFVNNNAVQLPLIFQTDNLGYELAASRQYQTGLGFLDIEPATNGVDIIIAGQTTSGDAILAKVDATGAQLWAKIFPNLTAFRKLVVRSNGDVYALGQRDAVGKYRNVIVKVRDLGASVSVIWQKYAELSPSTPAPNTNTEINWTPADLVWYSGKMFFFTDGRVKNSNGFGNEDIAAVLYELDKTTDDCPFTKEPVVSQNFTLFPAQLPPLGNITIIPPAPVVITNGTPLVLSSTDLCGQVACQCQFSNLAFTKTGISFPNWAVSVGSCPAAPITLPGCPAQTVPIKFGGLLKCSGGCSFAGLTWSLKDPNGGPVASGASTTASFKITMTLSMLQIPGTYTITLNGQCGAQNCQCIVQFIVPACPQACDCSEPGFSNAVHAGFNWLQLPNCVFQFTPKQLTTCDAVTWKVMPIGGSTATTFANSIGNNTVSHSFSNGQYVICMTVNRTVPGSGGVTCSGTRCFNLSLSCSQLTSGPDNLQFRDDPCDVTIIQNGGFTMGAEAGGLADIGSVEYWDYSGGNPEIALESGKLDTNLVRMRGNTGFSDLLYQDSLEAMGDSVSFTVALRPINDLVIPGTELVVRLSSDKQESIGCSESDCMELMRLPIPEFDTSIWLLAGTSATLGSLSMAYLTIHVENPFIDDDVALKSVVDIDNICLTNYITVSSHQPSTSFADIKIYPNPTTGALTLEWVNTDVKNGIIQLTGPLGQTLRNWAIPPGAPRMEVPLDDLPGGMYFVKLVSEGRLVAVRKVVRQ